MGIDRFLRDLQNTGRVLVGKNLDALSLSDTLIAQEILQETDRVYRKTLAYEAPEIDLSAALWAAEMLYRGCQFFVFREVEATDVVKELSRPCPGSAGPAKTYSVDLTFRYLPDLIKLAQGLAPNDPLVESLRRLAGEWPLSSVGVKEISPEALDAFIHHPALRQLYFDRILERKDLSRLKDPRIHDSLRACWGPHHELAPTWAQQLEEGAERE